MEKKIVKAVFLDNSGNYYTQDGRVRRMLGGGGYIVKSGVEMGSAEDPCDCWFGPDEKYKTAEEAMDAIDDARKLAKLMAKGDYRP